MKAIKITRASNYDPFLAFIKDNNDIRISVRMYIKKTTEDGACYPTIDGQKLRTTATNGGQLERTAAIWVKKDRCATIACTPGAQRTEQRVGNFNLEGPLAVVTPLTGILAKGNEGRMLAFKAILCLKQLILFNSLRKPVQMISMIPSGTKLEVVYGDLNLPYNFDGIHYAAESVSFVVNSTNINTHSLMILGYLVQKWPFQKIVRPDNLEYNDMYAALQVDADPCFIYDEKRPGPINLDFLFMIPEVYWGCTVSLFEALGMLDQLYEVLRETRGIAPALARFMNDDVQPITLTLNYGPTYSAESVRQIYQQSKDAFPFLSPDSPDNPNLLSLSTVILDIALGYIFLNNIHHLVESVGFCNDADYRQISDNEFRELMPWVPALQIDGDQLLRLIMHYSKLLEEYARTGENDIPQWTVIPFGFFDLRSGFSVNSSKRALAEPHPVPQTKLPYYLLLKQQSESRKPAIAWASAAGMDGIGVPIGGKLNDSREHRGLMESQLLWMSFDGAYCTLAGVSLHPGTPKCLQRQI